MGAQTRESLDAVATMATESSTVSPEALSGIFAAARVLADHPSLLSALADSSHDSADRVALLGNTLGGLDAGAKAVVSRIVGLNWSNPAGLLLGIEQAGIRLSASLGTPDTLVGQLLELSRVIRGHAELQLALSDKRATVASKRAIVVELGSKKMDPIALEVAAQVCSASGGRRASEALVAAAEVICEQDGRGLAEVRAATELTASQQQSLQKQLSSRFGTPCYLDVVIDPEVIGGARIRVGDVVIDGSVATQLGQMRRALAG